MIWWPTPYKAPNFTDGKTLLPPKPITAQSYKKPKERLQQGDWSNVTTEPVAPFALNPIVQGSKPILPVKTPTQTTVTTPQIPVQPVEPVQAPQQLPQTGVEWYKPMLLDKQEYIRVANDQEKNAFADMIQKWADPDAASIAFKMLVDKRVQSEINWNKIDINPFKPISEWLNKAKEFVAWQDNMLVNNPITRWWLWVLWTIAWWLTSFSEWTQNIASKWVSEATWITNPQEEKTTVWEDIFWTVSWLWSIATAAAPVASTAFNVWMESLPKSRQESIWSTLWDVWSFIAKTPWLKQWRESLPEEKRTQFDQELAWTAIALLTWVKDKGQAIKNPKQFLKTNLNPLNVARNIDEAVLNWLWTTIAWVKNIPKIPSKVWWAIEWGIENVATKLTKTATPQDKLFKAQEPRLNQLNKQVDYKKLRENSDIANQEIVKAWYKPVDTETRAAAHKATMDKIRKEEIESKIWDQYNIDLKPVADKIDEFVANAERAGIVTNQGQLNQLKAQAQKYREMWVINWSDWEFAKQMLNAQINNFWDASIWDVYKNWLKEATKTLWKQLDDAFSAIPWEFADAKRRFWALKSTYEDVFKSDLKAQKAKWWSLEQSYSRMEWAGDIVRWLTSTLAWQNPIPLIAQWWAKLLVWKVLQKIKDKDFLIRQWFDEIAKNTSQQSKLKTSRLSNRPALPLIDNKVDATPITPTGKVQEKVVIPPKKLPKSQTIVAEKWTAVSPADQAKFKEAQAKIQEITAKKQQVEQAQKKVQEFEQKASDYQKVLEGSKNYKKLWVFDILWGWWIKNWDYVTKYWTITDTQRWMSNLLEYKIWDKWYKARDVDVFEKWATPEIIPVKEADDVVKARQDIKDMQADKQRRNLYVNQLLEEMNLKSIDDLPADKLPEFAKILRTRNRSWEWMTRYENFVKENKSKAEKVPVKTKSPVNKWSAIADKKVKIPVKK